MTTRLRYQIPTALLSVLASSSLLRCSSNKTPQGELMLSVQTDMSIPKDVDQVRLEVSSYGNVLFANTYDVGPAGLRIPATLGLVGPGDGSSPPATIRLIARQANKARLLREVVTTIPRDRVASLRLPVEWLCDETAKEENGQVTSTCGEGQTCVAGHCQTTTVDSSTLADYRAADVFGGGTGTGDGRCFDTLGCFANGAMVPIDRANCTVDLSGLTAASDGGTGGAGPAAGSAADASPDPSTGGSGGGRADAGTTCGNGFLDEGEACDDGNLVSGDGCDSHCAVEAGFVCKDPGARCVRKDGASDLASARGVDLKDSKDPEPSTGGAAGLSLALVGGPKGAGICGADACLIPLDRNASGGWALRGSQAVLPSAVCQRLSEGKVLGIAATTACEAKTATLPTCGAWSSVTGVYNANAGAPIGFVNVGPKADSGATADAGEAWDASGLPTSDGGLSSDSAARAPRCVGTPTYTCSQCDQGYCICSDVPGCTSSAGGTCFGNEMSCSQYSGSERLNRAACAAVVGCTWTSYGTDTGTGECTGIPTNCSLASSYESCSRLPACSWAESKTACTGSPTPCNMLSVSHCSMTSGCFVSSDYEDIGGGTAGWSEGAAGAFGAGGSYSTGAGGSDVGYGAGGSLHGEIDGSPGVGGGGWSDGWAGAAATGGSNAGGDVSMDSGSDAVYTYTGKRTETNPSCWNGYCADPLGAWYGAVLAFASANATIMPACGKLSCFENAGGRVCANGTVGGRDARAGIQMNLLQEPSSSVLGSTYLSGTISIGVAGFVPGMLASLVGSDGTEYCALIPEANSTMSVFQFATNCWDVPGQYYYSTVPIQSFTVTLPGTADPLYFDFCIASMSATQGK